MKHSIIIFIFTVFASFASIDPLWVQKFTEPRIVAGKFDKWLTMRCFGSPLLSFGNLLEMIKGKFKLHMIN